MIDLKLLGDLLSDPKLSLSLISFGMPPRLSRSPSRVTGVHTADYANNEPLTRFTSQANEKPSLVMPRNRCLFVTDNNSFVDNVSFSNRCVLTEGVVGILHELIIVMIKYIV